jgi:hypothetical protein
MEEKVIVILGKNGGLENMEVQGIMTLQALLYPAPNP